MCARSDFGNVCVYLLKLFYGKCLRGLAVVGPETLLFCILYYLFSLCVSVCVCLSLSVSVCLSVCLSVSLSLIYLHGALCRGFG